MRYLGIEVDDALEVAEQTEARTGTRVDEPSIIGVPLTRLSVPCNELAQWLGRGGDGGPLWRRRHLAY